MATWKRDFASGLVVLVPIIVTLWVLLWLFNFIADAPLVNAIDESLLQTFGVGWLPVDAVRVVVTLVVFVTLVFAVGYLMRTALGRVVETTLDDVINRLPGLRIVYNASKMAAETALGGTDSLQTPVKVEPWEDVRMTAFKTGKMTPDGREILFMPTAPNITTGFVIEVDPDDVKELDEPIEDALTRLLSAGFGDANGQGPGTAGLGGVPIDVQEAGSAGAIAIDGDAKDEGKGDDDESGPISPDDDSPSDVGVGDED